MVEFINLKSIPSQLQIETFKLRDYQRYQPKGYYPTGAIGSSEGLIL